MFSFYKKINITLILCLNLCVIGLGYVGLPILINLSKKFNPIGYDINKKE